MKTIKFTEERVFDYGEGPVVHKVGDEVTLRDDKAQRWVTREVAYFIEPAKKQAAQEVKHDDALESPADVAGEDGSGSGKRALDEPKRGPGRPKSSNASHK